MEQPLPSYPAALQAAGIEGWVYLSFDIDSDGRPQSVRVLDSQPPYLFELSAYRAFLEWTYPRDDPREDARTVLTFRLR